MATQLRGLTEQDREFLEALLKYDTLTEACKSLGISVSSGSRRRAKISAMEIRAREIVREVGYYKTRMASKPGI